MRGRMHKLWGKTSGKSHSVASSYRNRAVKTDDTPPKPAILAERFDDARWSIVHTGPKQELVAAAALRKDGYAAYCPVITRWVTIGRLRTIRHVPLFPRYVFVGLKDKAARSLNSCVWAKALTLNNGSISMVRPDLVYGFSDRQADGMFDQVKADKVQRQARSTYKAGDAVVIENDLFQGVDATIVHAGDDERVIVLLDLLGRAQVTLDDIRPAA